MWMAARVLRSEPRPLPPHLPSCALGGCPGWSTCALGDTGNQPAPSGIAVNNIGPNRGDSPTMGCSQCGHCGSFG